MKCHTNIPSECECLTDRPASVCSGAVAAASSVVSLIGSRLLLLVVVVVVMSLRLLQPLPANEAQCALRWQQGWVYDKL